MACPYSNLLGVPGEGVHAQRFMGFALNDTIATVVVAILTSWGFNVSLLYSLIGWFVLGEVLHYVMCVDTAFLKLLTKKPKQPARSIY